MKYVVTRQGYWGVDPEDCYTVEIAEGGIDYCNPDALVAKYAGEFEEFIDPREAVQVALEIAEQWQKDCQDIQVNVAYGNTMGMTMPFEASEKAEVIAWGEKEYAGMPKCSCCGEIILEEWINPDSEWSGEKYCSEYCADKAYWQATVLCQECEKEIPRSEYDEQSGLCEDCLEKENID